MNDERVTWDELPERLRGRITSKVGPPLSIEPISGGQNSLLAVVVHTAGGSTFLKGVTSDHERAVWTNGNEAAVNPLLDGITPKLEFRIRNYGWDVLGFEYLPDTHHADLAPRSADLPLIAAALNTLSGLPAPSADLGLRPLADRLRDYIDPDQVHLLTGEHLAHTDLNPGNILLSDDDREPAWLVDWAWPTLAPEWVDTACVGLQLIAANWSSADAQRWCATVPAYAAAACEAVDAFVDAVALMWRESADQDPTRGWKVRVAGAAARWAAYRDLPG